MTSWYLVLSGGYMSVPFSGHQPIHAAAMNGHVRCLQWLLELGVDRDPRDKMGKTPLQWAAAFGRADIIKVLVAAGADLSANSITGQTAA